MVSDATITTIVTNVVTIVTIVVGWATLQTRLRYGTRMSEDAAIKAQDAVIRADMVEKKIDHNTEMTSKIEERTNGVSETTRRIIKLEEELTAMQQNLIKIINGFVQLKDYAHDWKHSLLNSLNQLSLKVDLIRMDRKKET